MKLDEILNIVAGDSPSAFFFTPPFYKNSKSYLYTNPERLITVNCSEEIDGALSEVQELINKGFAGYAAVSYEMGYLSEKRLKALLPEMGSDTPLMQFYIYRQKDILKLNSVEIDYTQDLLISNEHHISDFCLNVSKAEYIKSINKIKSYIAEGDTYQVNYTIKGKFQFTGSIPGLFLSGIFNQSARYCALINSGGKFIMSFSPELFFASYHKRLFTKPMKGTMKRGKNIPEDRLLLKQFKASTKDQAENLMITDLLRNDMGRISRFGSVSVEKLFLIEKYETLFQMVSLITSMINDKRQLKDIIMNLFPGGSITGAPKIRTMEIIRELEKEPRGIYTGAIGMFNKQRSVFNLPIRTLLIDKFTNRGEMGIGSGIVQDSDPEKEFEETLLKSSFLTKPEYQFRIFETMLMEDGQIFLADLHLKRMQSTAGFFLFRFNRKVITGKLSDICRLSDKSKKYRLKLYLDKWGMTRTEMKELNEDLKNMRVIISEKRIDSRSKYFYFKTTHRDLYTQEHKLHVTNGFNEVLFLNENNELCEGSFTNIFIKKKGIWYTPPVNCGLLNGTYRQMLLKDRKIYKEKTLYLNDLKNADEIKLVNSLRKEISVESVTVIREGESTMLNRLAP